MKDPMVEPVRWRRAGGGGREGFSLVELLYVMLILGLLAGMAVPLLDVNWFRMNAAVSGIATELMAAHRSAVLRGHNVIVALDPSGRRMRVHNDANNDGLIQGTETWKMVELGDGVTFGQAGSTKLKGASPPYTFQRRQGTYPAIIFHRNGSASEAGFFFLTGERGGAVAESDRALEIVRSTATVKCWSYHTGSWQETC